MNRSVRRCSWARSELSIRYHDEEWGVPCHDDRTLFEFLILEGAQAGLNWEIVPASGGIITPPSTALIPVGLPLMIERRSGL